MTFASNTKVYIGAWDGPGDTPTYQPNYLIQNVKISSGARYSDYDTYTVPSNGDWQDGADEADYSLNADASNGQRTWTLDSAVTTSYLGLGANPADGTQITRWVITHTWIIRGGMAAIEYPVADLNVTFSNASVGLAFGINS